MRMLAAVALLTLTGSVWGQEKTTVQLVRDVERAIVRIEMTGTVLVPTAGGLVENDGTMGGTGFLIEGGYIVTNWHVVAGESAHKWKTGPNLIVKSRAGTLICEKVGADELSDLAVLKIVISPPKALLDKDGKLPALKFADPKTLEIGQDVVAVGFGRLFEIDGKPTVTKGILSADERALTNEKSITYSGLLQTDAVINHGNSGGPLVNMRGEVIGVNTFVMFGTAEDPVHGVHFARSCNTAASLVQILIKDKKIERVSLGIQGVTYRQRSIDSFALEAGAVIGGVDAGSPAQTAGLKEYDIIYRINDWSILNQGDLNTALAFLKPGETISVYYLRPSPTIVARLQQGKPPARDDELVQAVLQRQFKTAKIIVK